MTTDHNAAPADELWNNTLFRGVESGTLSVEDITRFHIHDWETGETLMSQGETGDELLLLLEGSVDVIQRLPGGEEVSLGTLEPGACLGIIGVFLGRERSATIRALAPVRTAGIDRPAFLRLVEQVPTLRENVTRILIDALLSSDRAVAYEKTRANFLSQMYQTLRDEQHELEQRNRDLDSDVARETRLSEQLRDALESRDRLISILAHDLKNPLNYILGTTQYLSRQYDQLPREKVRHLIMETESAAGKLNELLEELLDWTRVVRGRIDPQPVVLNIREVMNDVLAIFQTGADLKEITLINQVPDETLVWGDRRMIFTIFRNLVSNALKYTEPNGLIRIWSEYRTGRDNRNDLAIIVQDNGVGMDRTTLSSISGNKPVSPMTGTRNEKGIGYGLVIIREFVRLNHGRLEVESAPGKGTRFTVVLPVQAVESILEQPEEETIHVEP